VIDATLLAAETSEFDGSVFHIVDRTRITQNQVVRDYISTNAKKAKVIHVPVAVVYTLALCVELLAKVLKRPAPLSRYRLKSALAHMQFDCSRAENDLGWRPRVGVASGLQETMASERAKSRNNVIGRVQESWVAK
jgi:nucleoside-diphosphate-sugar epimerase